jgi:hypothetical protein
MRTGNTCFSNAGAVSFRFRTLNHLQRPFLSGLWNAMTTERPQLGFSLLSLDDVAHMLARRLDVDIRG